MKGLENSLGKAISAKELAKYLGINEKLVRLHYKILGGIRIGRNYRFFERRIIHALEKRQPIYSANQEVRSAQREGISHPEGSKKVGIGNEKDVRRRLERNDRHNLFS